MYAWGMLVNVMVGAVLGGVAGEMLFRGSGAALVTAGVMAAAVVLFPRLRGV